MYAIPAETASQGEPFQKDKLPGPGEFFEIDCSYTVSATSRIYSKYWMRNGTEEKFNEREGKVGKQ